jgi:hypothetical protein
MVNVSSTMALHGPSSTTYTVVLVPAEEEKVATATTMAVTAVAPPEVEATAEAAAMDPPKPMADKLERLEALALKRPKGDFQILVPRKEVGPSSGAAVRLIAKGTRRHHHHQIPTILLLIPPTTMEDSNFLRLQETTKTHRQRPH